MDSRDPKNIDQLVAQLVSASYQPPGSSNPPQPFTPTPTPPQPSQPSRPVNSPSLQSPIPSRPPSPPSAQPPAMPKPTLPLPPSKPAYQPPIESPPSSGPSSPSSPIQEYQSAIRTMESDLATMKSGKDMSGANIQKTFSTAPKTPPPPPIKEVLPPAPSKEVQTSSQSKTIGFNPKPLNVEKKFNIPGSGSGSAIKEESKLAFATPKPAYNLFGNKQFLILGGIVLVLIAAGVYGYYIWNPSSDQVVITPTPTPAPSTIEAPELSVFDQKLGSSEDMVLLTTDQGVFAIGKMPTNL